MELREKYAVLDLIDLSEEGQSDIKVGKEFALHTNNPVSIQASHVVP